MVQMIQPAGRRPWQMLVFLALGTLAAAPPRLAGFQPSPPGDAQPSATAGAQSLGPAQQQLVRKSLELLDKARSLDPQTQSRQAIALGEEALQLQLAALGEKHYLVGTTVFWLAVRYELEGDAAKAESLYRRASGIFAQVLRPDDEHVASCLERLAVVYLQTDRVEQAAASYLQMVAIRSQAAGYDPTEHRKVLASLAGLLDRQVAAATQRGQWPEASRAAEQLVAVRTALSGPEHWETADARLSVAHVRLLASLSDEQHGQLQQAEALRQTALRHYRQQRSREAIAAERQALDILRTVLGEEHRLTASKLEDLAHLHAGLNELDQCEPYLLRCLAVRRKVLGEQHPRTASTLCDLGLLAKRRGQYADAVAWFRPGVAALEASVGTSHDDFLERADEWDEVLDAAAQQAEQQALETGEWNSVIELRREQSALRGTRYGPQHWKATDAVLHLRDAQRMSRLPPEQQRRFFDAEQLEFRVAELLHQGRIREALPLELQCLAIRREVLGEEHPLTAHTWSMVGRLYSFLGASPQAEQALRQAVDISRNVHGEQHPELATHLAALAEFYRLRSDYETAEPLSRQCLEIRQAALGLEHADTAAAFGKLAELYVAQAAYHRAEPLLKQSLAIAQRVFGPDDPRTAWAKVGMAQLYTRQKQYREAEAHLQQALAVFEQVAQSADPYFLGALAELGQLYVAMQRHEEAETVLQRVLEVGRRESMHNHPVYQAALTTLVLSHLHTSRHEAAAALLREVAELHRARGGDRDRLYLQALGWLCEVLSRQAEQHERHGRWDEARAARREALQHNVAQYGADHWRVEDAQRALDHIHRLATLDAAQQQRLQQAARLEEQFREHHRREELRGAIAAGEQLLAIRREVLGEKHVDTAVAMQNLAALYDDVNQPAKAEQYYQRAIELYERLLGTDHPLTAMAYGNLGEFRRGQGDLVQAASLRQRCLEIYQQTLGEDDADTAFAHNRLGAIYRELGQLDLAQQHLQRASEVYRRIYGIAHADTARSINSLAVLYHRRGQYARAERLYRQCLEIQLQVLGPEHTETATSFNNLAQFYFEINDMAQAERDFRRALEIRRKLLGPEHREIAQSLNSLAVLYVASGRYEEAVEHYKQSYLMYRSVLGEEHPDSFMVMSNWGNLSRTLGQLDLAEQQLSRCLALCRQVLGEAHRHTALVANNLALVYEGLGRHDEAIALLRQSVALHRAAWGAQHPETALSLRNLATLEAAQGRPPQAVAHLQEALAIELRHLRDTFGSQSERQQLGHLAALRQTLDVYLSVAPLAGTDPAEVFGRVLACKGVVFSQQALGRVQRHRPDLAPLVAELRSVTTQLAALVHASSATDRQRWTEPMERLAQRREELERILSDASAAFRAEDAAARWQPGELLQALPPATVLVDTLRYVHHTPPQANQPQWTRQQRYVAFVLRPGEAIRQVDLGPAEAIDQAVNHWRSALGSGSRATQAGASLRKLVWQPIEPHLHDAQVVVFSPDGDLGRFPLAALPGANAGTYLIEERAVALVAVPQRLPQLLGQPMVQRNAEATLLLLGDVEFGQRPAATGNDDKPPAAFRFRALPGTSAEIDAISQTLSDALDEDRIVVLRGKQATKQALRDAAADARLLHLATHGFFNPGGWKSALDAPAADLAPRDTPSSGMAEFRADAPPGFHPGLLSGLALANANAGLGADGPAVQSSNDGILTALEVAEMDLGRTELVVLSACDTALGQQTSGEGLLGLQRAFQMAGAGSVVASLWKVPDLETQRLMTRFYDNLWNRKLSKLEALRQAQIWMLREGRASLQAERIARGADPDDLLRGADPLLDEDAGSRLPPYYWAAFVLSGDWR
jgi:CHAT domain-containing protein